MIFTGGGYREAYTASLRQSLSGQLDLILRGAVERGQSDDRVFDSVISLALSFRLPTAKPEAPKIPADEIDAPHMN